MADIPSLPAMSRFEAAPIPSPSQWPLSFVPGDRGEVYSTFTSSTQNERQWCGVCAVFEDTSDLVTFVMTGLPVCFGGRTVDPHLTKPNDAMTHASYQNDAWAIAARIAPAGLAGPSGHAAAVQGAPD